MSKGRPVVTVTVLSLMTSLICCTMLPQLLRASVNGVVRAQHRESLFKVLRFGGTASGLNIHVLYPYFFNAFLCCSALHNE